MGVEIGFIWMKTDSNKSKMYNPMLVSTPALRMRKIMCMVLTTSSKSTTTIRLHTTFLIRHYMKYFILLYAIAHPHSSPRVRHPQLTALSVSRQPSPAGPWICVTTRSLERKPNEHQHQNRHRSTRCEITVRVQSPKLLRDCQITKYRKKRCMRP